jgi:hypothetical protein
MGCQCRADGGMKVGRNEMTLREEEQLYDVLGVLTVKMYHSVDLLTCTETLQTHPPT